ncbi:MAG: serine hydrolase domain-containing protein [Bryobacteraceae bacterium]
MLRRSFLAQFALALRQDKLESAANLLKEAARLGNVGAATAVVRHGDSAATWAVGSGKPESVYLLASITKPMTVTAAMMLVERGEVKLDDPVKKYVPEFRAGARERILVRHLLTHSSGLPDMLPENEELRKRHAPLTEFVARTCRTPLLFEPGTDVKYQSMGILMAAEIVERVTKTPLRRFLQEKLFAPLGMASASLGTGGRPLAALSRCEVTGNDDWNWNSPYWRDLGSPWGGAHASAADVERLLRYFLNPGARVLKPETARAMIRNQNGGLKTPWGFGWVVGGERFGRACSASSFGHSGSTGTLAWADPASGVTFVLLTTRPAAESNKAVIRPVSEAAAAAMTREAA